MGEDPDPIPTGTKGTVVSVNGGFYRNEEFQILVKWEIPRSLMLVWPTDQIRVLEAA